MNGIPANQRLESAPGVNRPIGTNLKKRKGLSYDRLRGTLTYNPYTGIFFWKNNQGSMIAGTEAGCNRYDGRIQIRIDKKPYLAHRLAWFYSYGYMPENDLDHIDRNPKNNRIDNLREVSRSCNMRNCGNPNTNTSGIKGVCWDKRVGKWQAHITVDIRTYNLGYYHDFDDAVCARLAAEQCLDWAGCDSSSPAYKYTMGLTAGYQHSIPTV